METLRIIPDSLVKNYALSFLSQGRKEFDIPHSKSVTHYATVIAACERLNIKVLRTTGWLHDIGYFGQFESLDPSQYQAVMDKKTAHMVSGEKLARQFFQNPEITPLYTPEEIDQICHLVSVHDKLEELSSTYEIAFMEADTLGAIDIARVKPTFGYESGIAYIRKDLLGRRLPRFKTRTGIALAKIIVPRFINYFKALSPTN